MEVLAFEENFEFSSLATIELLTQVIIQSCRSHDLRTMCYAFEILRGFKHIIVLWKRALALSRTKTRFANIVWCWCSAIIPHTNLLLEDSGIFLLLF